MNRPLDKAATAAPGTRPPEPESTAPSCSNPRPSLALAIGIATADAIAQTTGLACDLRWPNDLMLAGKKLGGILVQIANARAIAGIGINLNQTEFPPELAATSLRLAAGREFPREPILAALIPAIERHAALPTQQILALFTQASSYAYGRRVSVEQPGGPIRGVTEGLDAAGFLRVRQDDGTMTLILAGGVRAASA